MTLYFQSFQRSLLICHTLKLIVEGLYFTGMIISLGTIDVMLQIDVLTNFTQQALQYSQKAISTFNAEQIQIRKVILQNRLALGTLMATQGRTCTIIHTQCCTYIPDRSTNVTHFIKYMNEMIQAMDSPEASVTSLWEMLTISSW